MLALTFISKTSLASTPVYTEKSKTTSNLYYEGAKLNIVKASSVDENGNDSTQIINYVETLPEYKNIKLVHWTYNHDYTWSLRTLSELAKDYEKRNPDYEIIAGMNGCFFNMSSPYYPFGDGVFNGRVMSNYMSWLNHDSYNMGVNDNNEIFSATVAHATYETTYTLYVYDETGNYLIGSFNLQKGKEVGENRSSIIMYKDGQVPNDESVAYFNVGIKDAINGSMEDERDFIKYPLSDSSYEFYYAEGVVSSIGGGIELDSNMFTIASKDQTLIDLVKVGKTKFQVQKNVTGQYESAYHMGGTGGLIVNNGKARDVSLAENSTAKGRHPRTAIGQREDGSFILMAVDGREESTGRYGMTSYELGITMKNYGAKIAYMMDGGGSTTLLLRNTNNELVTVNQLSDGNERSVSDAWFLVVPKVDSKLTLNQYDDTNVKVNVSNVITNTNITLKEINLVLNGNKVKIDENKELDIAFIPDKDNFVSLEYIYIENGVEKTMYSRSYIHNTKENKIFIAPNNFDLTVTRNNSEIKFEYTFNGDSSSIKSSHILINDKKVVFIKGVAKASISDFNLNDVTEIKLQYKYLDDSNKSITKVYNKTFRLYLTNDSVILLDTVCNVRTALVGKSYLDSIKDN